MILPFVFYDRRVSCSVDETSLTDEQRCAIYEAEFDAMSEQDMETTSTSELQSNLNNVMSRRVRQLA